MTYTTINVRIEGTICYLQLYRPEANNTITDTLISECQSVLERCEKEVSIVVLEGLPEVFCFGADFQHMISEIEAEKDQVGSEKMYDLWLQLATGPYITVAHVKGKVNAGGVGFVAACDIVLSDTTSELLFGLFPACVLPFLRQKQKQSV